MLNVNPRVLPWTILTFYNVMTDDPELMQMLEGYRNNADFHYHYLREILKEHGLSYSKSRPKEVLEESFFLRNY